jgi:hypothetical protein
MAKARLSAHRNDGRGSPDRTIERKDLELEIVSRKMYCFCTVEVPIHAISAISEMLSRAE